jgi:Jacalin-like lectin domain
LLIGDGHIPKEMTMPQVQKLGLSGGSGGREFSDDAIPSDSKVIEVQVRAGRLIDAVQITHESAGGARHPFPRHGGGGGELYVFTLDSNEYITGISGRYGSRVDSLRIHTNLQTSPLYGGTGGFAEYHYEVPPGTEIVGFYGRSGAVMDAIGVLYRSR